MTDRAEAGRGVPGHPLIRLLTLQSGGPTQGGEGICSRLQGELAAELDLESEFAIGLSCWERKDGSSEETWGLQ